MAETGNGWGGAHDESKAQVGAVGDVASGSILDGHDRAGLDLPLLLDDHLPTERLGLARQFRSAPHSGRAMLPESALPANASPMGPAQAATHIALDGQLHLIRSLDQDLHHRVKV